MQVRFLFQLEKQHEICLEDQRAGVENLKTEHMTNYKQNKGNTILTNYIQTTICGSPVKREISSGERFSKDGCTVCQAS